MISAHHVDNLFLEFKQEFFGESFLQNSLLNEINQVLEFFFNPREFEAHIEHLGGFGGLPPI